MVLQVGISMWHPWLLPVNKSGLIRCCFGRVLFCSTYLYSTHNCIMKVLVHVDGGNMVFWYLQPMRVFLLTCNYYCFWLFNFKDVCLLIVSNGTLWRVRRCVVCARVWCVCVHVCACLCGQGVVGWVRVLPPDMVFLDSLESTQGAWLKLAWIVCELLYGIILRAFNIVIS